MNSSTKKYFYSINGKEWEIILAKLGYINKHLISADENIL